MFYKLFIQCTHQANIVGTLNYQLHFKGTLKPNKNLCEGKSSMYDAYNDNIMPGDVVFLIVAFNVPLSTTQSFPYTPALQ